MLEGLVRRCKIMGVAAPLIAVLDNCCHVRNAMTPILAFLCIVLDVYHFKRRFVLSTICVLIIAT